MTRARGFLIAAACIVAALALSLVAPDDSVKQAPYVRVIAGYGIPTESRVVTVSVTGARLADRVQTPDWTGTTNGVWLVVDVEYARRTSGGGLAAAFRIGDTHYRASERAGLATIDQGASGKPDLPWTGSVLIELPRSALDDPSATHAVISFAGFDSTLSGGELDGVLDFTLDLTSLDHERSITVMEPSRIPPWGVAP